MNGRLLSRLAVAGLVAGGGVSATAATAGAATLTGIVASGTPGVASASPTFDPSRIPATERVIAGSRVTLFHARANRAVPLGSATTGADGSFSLDYRRPAGRRVLYAVARGGAVADASAGTPPGNAISLMSVVAAGRSPLTSVTLTELTTVSSAFALAQFLSGVRVTGPSPGLPNAAATAANLADPRTGKLATVIANSPNGNATEALPTFNTIANILARCTRGTRADCSRVFTAATPPGRARPTDTLATALNIARRPTHNVRRLFRLQRGVFRPALRSAPNAWTLALVYTDGGFNAPGRMAFDSEGRVWSNNNFQAPGTDPGLGVAVLSPTGQPILNSPVTGGGLRGSGFGVAIDRRDRVWVSNFGGNSVSLFSSSGRALSGPNGFTTGNLSEPQGIAIDARDNVWIPNQGTTHVTRYPNGNPRAAQQISGGGINSSFDIALDAGRNAWVTNGSVSPDPAGNSSVTKILPDGTIDPISPITGGGLLSPMAIAVDSAGNKWVGNLASSSVTVIGPNGRVRPLSPIRTGSIRGGWGVAVDGSDNVWVASFLDPRLTQLCGRRTSACPPGTATGEPISPPITGFTSRGLQHLTAVQVDQSGNVWVANNWSTSSPFQRFVGGNGLVEFIGVSTPVVTPLIGLPRRP